MTNSLETAGQLIKVRVLFFGAARDHAGRDEAELTLRAPASAASAFEEILAL